MQRILCIVTGSEGYGVRQVWNDLIAGFAARGDQITIAVLDSQFEQAWRKAYPQATIIADCSPSNYTVGTGHNAFYKTLLSRARQLINHKKWVGRYARDFKPTCILVQISLDVPLAGLIARQLGVNAYWFVPNYISADKPLDINRRIYRGLFRVLPVIPVSNSHFTDYSFGPGNFMRHVVHLGVDISKYCPTPDEGIEVRRHLGIPETATVIGLHGRMTESKGQARLIEAVAQISLDCHILFCGGPVEGLYFDSLKRRIAELNLVNRVHFVGYQRELRPYYAACDLITNLRDVPEAFGLSVIEAMACGKPVLAHALGGPSETVLDTETGWLIQDWRVPAITEGLQQALSQRKNWTAMGDAARLRVIKRFSIDLFHENTADVINHQRTKII